MIADKIKIIDVILENVMFAEKRLTNEQIREEVMELTPNELIEFISDMDDAVHDIYNIIHDKED